MYKILYRLPALLLLAVFVRAPDAFAAGASLAITNAWVRAMPPGQASTAAYMQLVNRGSTDVDIVAASSDISERAEFHRTRQTDGYMRMDHLPTLRVQSGGSLLLAPAGIHLMLLGLQRTPSPGDSVQLCLQPKAGDPVCAAATVRKAGSAMPSHGHHH